MRTIAKSALILALFGSLAAPTIAAEPVTQRPDILHVFSQVVRGHIKKKASFRGTCNPATAPEPYELYELTFIPTNNSLSRDTVEVSYTRPLVSCTDSLTFRVNGRPYPIPSNIQSIPDTVYNRILKEL